MSRASGFISLQLGEDAAICSWIIREGGEDKASATWSTTDTEAMVVGYELVADLLYYARNEQIHELSIQPADQVSATVIRRISLDVPHPPHSALSYLAQIIGLYLNSVQVEWVAKPTNTDWVKNIRSPMPLNAEYIAFTVDCPGCKSSLVFGSSCSFCPGCGAYIKATARGMGEAPPIKALVKRGYKAVMIKHDTGGMQ